MGTPRRGGKVRRKKKKESDHKQIVYPGKTKSGINSKSMKNRSRVFGASRVGVSHRESTRNFLKIDRENETVGKDGMGEEFLRVKVKPEGDGQSEDRPQLSAGPRQFRTRESWSADDLRRRLPPDHGN